MAEEDDRRGKEREDLRCVMHVEHVFVFVVRRAVTQKNALMHHGADGEIAQKPAVGRTEMLSRPERRGLCRLIEAVRIVETRRDAIVIAANVDLAAAQRAHRVEDLIRLRAVADEIAETDDCVELLPAHPLKHDAEGLRIRMEIADDERSHARLHADFFAASRTLFGSSSNSRSTISMGVSSSRVSMVMSDIR